MERKAIALIALLGVLTSLAAAAAPKAPELKPTEGYLPQFTRTVKAATRARVAIKADFPAA